MTPEGDYLSGAFACSNNGVARQVIEEGWRKFEALSMQRGYAKKPVPANVLGHKRGGHVPSGGLKLEVAVRDLPRGDNRRPGNAEWQKKAFNLNWIDLSPREASSFVTTKAERVPLPDTLVRKLALEVFKDTARGQSGWPRNGFRGGALFTECVGNTEGRISVRITGNARLRGPGNAYAPAVYGRAVYNERAGEFESFDLVAAGERRGGTRSNFRQDDTTPGPLGVALTMAN